MKCHSDRRRRISLFIELGGRSTPKLEGYANLFVYTTLGEMRANLRKIMNSKIKILIGILVIGIVLAGGYVSGEDIYTYNLGISVNAFKDFSSKVRNYFDEKYKMTGGDYSIGYDLKNVKWLEENVPDSRLIQAYATHRMPAITETFIYLNGRTYVMPDDFNKFACDTHLQIIDENDALGISDVYVKAWEPSGSVGIPAAVILQSVNDIPQRINLPVPENIAHQIKSPLVKRVKNNFVVELYS